MNAVHVDGTAQSARVGIRTDTLVEKAGSENFPVALWILPRHLRDDLITIYGYARLVDDVGDLSSGDRLVELDWVEAEFERALEGTASEPIVRRAGALALLLQTGSAPFINLIEANRRDQRVTRYRTFAELQEYCSLSANPVGRLVLAVFGLGGDELVRLSDDVCTGLQLIEHWQDVVEDFRSGRVYLPAEDRIRFGVDEATIERGVATPAFRRLMAYECARARELLRSGDVLAARLHGWARVAISGFVGGGYAQLDAIERRRFDVLSGLAKASRVSVARHGVVVLREASRKSR
ncbi:MAG: squalene synthase HpnC [Acidimicrobiales bacterium]